MGDFKVTLLDTPGHVDFSAEMERTLPLLDYAILVVNGSDGVQGHTKTLWNLLRQYRVPTFLFVNKMDLEGNSRQELMEHLQNKLSSRIVDMTEVTLDSDEIPRNDQNAKEPSTDRGAQSSVSDFCELQGEEDLLESLAVCDDFVMEKYLENAVITKKQVTDMVANRQTFLCYFGSALKSDGVDKLLDGIACYAKVPQYPDTFAARRRIAGAPRAGRRCAARKLPRRFAYR